ncbi:hypothetical protein MINTM005_12980 [Mycobacterium intracellulare]|uniref:DUF3846 domain-containing protein n=1 Tax=Mycobacterium intracellulare TaxID=1767 RepID=UPI00192843D8|nr:DUF3846 domain-containing protein [Mycobacterium intracellulare]BCO56054.1 hypothetical protein MINTM005_12980 [Mycobacterium intracellulare]
MRALYIPADREQRIEVIDIEDDYRAINAKIGCHTMDAVGTRHLDFFVDDEGLLVADPQVNYRATDLYWVDGGYRGQMLVGNVIVAGPPDSDGEGTDFPGFQTTIGIRDWWDDQH